MSNISLDPYLDIILVENLKGQILNTIEKDGDLTLDASNVERITTPCIQLLVAAGKALSQKGQSLKVVNATDAFESAFQDIGLEKLYQEWSN